MVASLHVSTGFKSNTYLQMSRTVVLTLKKGDHVKVVNNVSSYKGTVFHRGYFGFSGAKLS